MKWIHEPGDHWGVYTRTVGGNYLATIEPFLKYTPTNNVISAQFILDTGAVVSVAPLLMAAALLGETKAELAKRVKPLDPSDFHGKKLEGFVLPVTLMLASEDADQEILEVSERIWFCTGRERPYGLLGQTFFEQIGALFLNFPEISQGRVFGLFKRG